MPSLMNNFLFYSLIDVVYKILRQMNTDKEVVHFNLNLTGEQRSRLRGVHDREGGPCNVKTLGLPSHIKLTS